MLGVVGMWLNKEAFNSMPFRFGFGLKSQTMGEELGAVPQQDISEAASKIDKQGQTCVDKK